MKNKQEIIRTLKKLKSDLKRYRVKKIELFGSVTRGEQSKTGDIDILVDFEEHADLLDLSGLALFLEEKLKRKVDVVPRRALRQEIKKSVLKEAISL
jgi:hypothetical protein